MFYEIVYFLSPAAVAAGAKVALVGGKYLTTVPAGITIQAINGGRPPADQSAQVAALTAQVAQLTADLAACIAGNPPPVVLPTIANMAVDKPNLPQGGGPVVVDATVTGANVTLALKLDGIDVPGPIVLPHTLTVT